MPRVSDFLRSKTWHNVELFPESVPHLLHWDLAYLWVLEKEPELRPRGWAQRIEAWKRLLSLFLLGKIELRPASLDDPFRNAVKRFGIERVSVLYSGGRPLGFISPVILVRPFPDEGGVGDGPPLKDWPGVPPDEPALLHVVKLVIDALVDPSLLQDPQAVTQRLAKVLRREFPAARAREGYRTESLTLDLLDRVTWSGKSQFRSVTIMRRHPADGLRKPVWVPRCQECDRILTTGPESGPVSAGSDSVTLRCKSNHETNLSLDKFMVWRRNASERVVWVVWKDRGRVTAGGGGAEEIYPGAVTVRGRVLTFEWDPGDVGGSDERFLAVLLREGDVTLVESVDIMYAKVLVLGDDRGFAGLPIRIEWHDALEDFKPPQWLSSGELRFDLKLRGWPFRFQFVKTAIERRQRAAMAVYPKYMGVRWKQYRIFTVGASTEDIVVATEDSLADGARSIPWCLEIGNGWPAWVGAIRASDPNVGVTFRMVADRSTSRSEGPPKHFALAVDFGTSSTLVYGQLYEDERGPDPGTDGVRRTDLLEMAEVVAGPAGALEQESPTRFLPPSRSDVIDPFLIPSAVWSGGDFPIVRWGPDAPFEGAKAVHSFKWDSQDSKQTLRVAYLKELLFLTLPAILRSAQPAQVTVGWGYPLAFGQAELQQMEAAWAEVREYLKGTLGVHDVRECPIDESRANVLAFGEHEHGKVFLVADMGGSTVDVAVFTFREGRKVEYFQVGSLRFAGEVFISAYQRRHQEPDYWKCRDTIERQTSQVLLRREAGLLLFNQFVSLVYDCLRVMVQAFQKQLGQDLELVLVGNGWRTVTAVDERVARLGEEQVSVSFYDFLTKQLGVAGLGQYQDAPRGYLTKHLAVKGMLIQAKTHLDQRTPQVVHACLPAGIGMTFSLRGEEHQIGWHQLVGPGIQLFENADATWAKNSNIRFSKDDMPQRLEKWVQHLTAKFSSVSRLLPDEELLRAAMRQNLKGAPAAVHKGPMQLVLETQWTNLLDGT